MPRLTRPSPFRRVLLLLACLAGAALAPSPAIGAEPVKIGILAFRPKPQTLAQWQPLASVLKQAIPERDFVIEALVYGDLQMAVASRQVDFLLSSPGHYVLLTKRIGLSAPLATLVVDQSGQRSTVFGGVIFSRAGQDDINTLGDIKDKTVALVSTDSLGAYQMQAYELRRAGIHLAQDNNVITTGQPQDNVVDAVLAGRADVGFVRTGLLEDMVREGKLDSKRIKVLNRQNLPDFPVPSSTRLYPEWPFAYLPHVDESLARRVAAALFLLQEDSAATRAMGIRGFTVPADYTPVVDLLRELRLPPFEAAPEFTLNDVWTRYRWQLIGGFLLIGLIVLLGMRLLLTKRKLEAQHHILLQQERQLQENEAKLQATLDAVPDLLFELGLDGRYHACHSPRSDLLLAPPEDLLGKLVADVMPAAETAVVLAALQEANERGYSSGKQIALAVPQGNMWFELSLARKTTLPDEAHRFIVLSRDITERKLAEEKLQLAASVFSHAREGIMITVADGTIIDVNDAFMHINGYSRAEVLGQNPRLLNSGRHDQAFYAALWRDLIENGHWSGEVWNRRKNGEVYAVMQTISAVRDIHGDVLQYVALFSDITALKEHERQLEHIAHYDALTTLPNRVLLADRLHQAMAQAQRREQQLAVAYLDLDGFKAINDQHGHEVGDRLLMTVATRMKQALREGDTLARLGGDEFVAVLLDLADVAASEPLLNRLLSAAAQPVHVDELVLQVSASLGVTFYPQAGDIDADQLLRQADQAMYQAKLAGKNRYHVFDTKQDSSVRGHHASLEHIRRALAAHEFVLHYQPKVNMRTGKVIGAEALIRWQDPEKGLLLPAAFLPLIEDHPLAIEIGEWVIDAALQQMTRWHAAGLNIPVSVNVGARQLLHTDFPLRLREILAAHPAIKPGDLELEVLETSALEDLARASEVIDDCRAIGVTFALDDFGTGYSSLTYLKRLSVSQLKIDQSFVRDMLDDPDDLSILEGVIGLATAFRHQVIAEGVEAVEHGEMLLQLGCELAQGYGIARPMPGADLPGWAAAWRPDPLWLDLPAVNRDDLPLLFASVEHRAWIVAMEKYLQDERQDPPPLDLHRCRFGAWLDTEGGEHHGSQPVFQLIERLHCQVHELAAALCELKAQGRNPEALARLDELRGLRDTLLEQLKALLLTRRQ